MDNSEYKKVNVKTWYLKYAQTIPFWNKSVHFQLWFNPDFEEYLNLYNKVGSKWGWTGRLIISKNELNDKLNSADNEIWLFQPEGKTIGFFEIDYSEKEKAEIIYLGLIPSETGKGYGKEFLNAAIAIAGRKDNEVWLHTCEYDHPNALNMYISAGFEIISETVENEYYPVGFVKDKG